MTSVATSSTNMRSIHAYSHLPIQSDARACIVSLGITSSEIVAPAVCAFTGVRMGSPSHVPPPSPLRQKYPQQQKVFVPAIGGDYAIFVVVLGAFSGGSV